MLYCQKGKKLTCKKISVFEEGVSAVSIFYVSNKLCSAVLRFYMTARDIVAFTLDQQRCRAPLTSRLCINWPLGAATL